jgi:hypothetical protein
LISPIPRIVIDDESSSWTVIIIDCRRPLGDTLSMATTLEEMEKRLARLEEEVAFLRQSILRPQVEETPAERGARLIREAALSQPQTAAAWAKAMEQMGISGEPVGAERLQEMMTASGIKPEDNILSREIGCTRVTGLGS